MKVILERSLFASKTFTAVLSSIEGFAPNLIPKISLNFTFVSFLTTFFFSTFAVVTTNLFPFTTNEFFILLCLNLLIVSVLGHFLTTTVVNPYANILLIYRYTILFFAFFGVSIFFIQLFIF